MSEPRRGTIRLLSIGPIQVQGNLGLKVGSPLEVMPIEDHERAMQDAYNLLMADERAMTRLGDRVVELERLRQLAQVACEAEFTGERLAAMGFLRSALRGDKSLAEQRPRRCTGHHAREALDDLQGRKEKR